MSRWKSLSGGWATGDVQVVHHADDNEPIVCKGSFDDEWVAKIFQNASRNKNGRVPWILVANRFKRNDNDPEYTLLVPVEEIEPQDEFNQERNP